MTPYLLLLLGLLAIFIEFFTPGGFFALIGAILLFTSLFTYASQDASGMSIFLYLGGVLILTLFTCKFALWTVRRSGISKSFYSEDSQEGFQACSFDASLIGKSATVYTDLRPGGHIEIDGRIYTAISESGYIPKGQKVVIRGGSGESYFVHTVNKE